jgi:hypothetical protein
VGIAGTMVMLAAAIVVVPQRGKADDVDKVLVVNGPKKPVPVTGNVAIGGTANVNVTNTPNVSVANQPTVGLAPGTNVGVNGTVNANVTNSPNVNVTGLPAVQLAPGTSVGINGMPSVNLANQPTVNIAPGTVVGVRSEDALRPVSVNAAGTFTNSSPIIFDVFTVPAGKRFVLEDISGEADVTAGQRIGEVILRGSSSRNEVYAGPPVFIGTQFGPGGRDVFEFGRLARAYFEPGEDVTATAFELGTVSNGQVAIDVHGYLVDVS